MTTRSVTKVEVNGTNYTAREIRQLIKALETENELYKKTAVCPVCGKRLGFDGFYSDSNENNKTGRMTVCKDCLRKVLGDVGEDGVEHETTKESLIAALKLINKPFLNDLYERAMNTVSSTKGEQLHLVYFQLLRNDQIKNWDFSDSDFFRMKTTSVDPEKANLVTDPDAFEEKKQLAVDREDVVKLIGYDPFVSEAYSDQPFLYSQLLGILDSSDDSADDQMKIQSAVSIVRSFLQIAKIDDSLSKLMRNPADVNKFSGDINKLQDGKTKIQAGITKLAAESCISLKNSKNSTKGDNTWTGKVKKCKDLSLRAAENNGYDLKTCKGMQQCADISSKAIIKALKLDESEYSDMLAEQRSMLTDLQKKCSKAEETARILLRENLDLKDLLYKNSIDLVDDVVSLDELLTSFDEDGGEKE